MTFRTFGVGHSRVFILSPVMPVWDEGGVLSVFGEKSQLVGVRNVLRTRGRKQRSLCVEGGGMRPLADDLKQVLDSIDAFLMTRQECVQ